jgi:phospholipid/cholesterol/gamma-HCH transport system substrate-binding protein
LNIMSERATEFRIGLFVLTALIVLAVLVTIFGTFPRIFTAQNHYTITLPTAPGIGPGTPVRRLGVRVGEVQDVRIEDGKVHVDIAVDPKQQIMDNEVPVLAQGVLGDTAIDFLPRKDEKATGPIEPGAQLVGVVKGGVSEALSGAGDLAPQVRQSLTDISDLARDARAAVPELEKAGQEIRLASRNWSSLGERLNVLVRTNEEKLIKTLENLNKTLEDMSRVFSDENVRNLNATLKNARGASDNFGTITKNADELLIEAQKAVKRIEGSLQRADEVFSNLQRATKPMADRSDSVMRNLDEGSAKLDKLLGELREVLRMVTQEDSTARRLLTDPSLYQNVNDAACMVTKILPRLDRILADIEIFADKIARHPESIGIGGVVRPGSGIK